jgi:hypothetical protein
LRFQLCEEDRTHFQAPEWLEFDPRNITVGELEELAARYGFDAMEWPAPFYGELTLEQAGDPDATPKPPPWRNRALAWMLLRQNGLDVSWEDSGAMHLFLMVREPEPEVEAGKDSTETPTSEASDVSTTGPSGTSSD